MLKKLRNFFSKPKVTVNLHHKLANHFLDCADQGSGVPNSSLGHTPMPTGVLSVWDIKVVNNSKEIGWLQLLHNNPGTDVLIVGHFGMDTAYTQNGYAIHMIKGFAKTVKQQFPYINYLDFYEMRYQGLKQAVTPYYLNFFQKHGMIPHSGNIYRYKI
ncbi:MULTISPECIES: hypothetical protein [Pantoea]|uniref:hypothetical protein n=1 Tax=Pantoea TaxID=53335 RepID=UPI0028AB6646|nr:MULTISPECIES: hypothetical protein [Pantoea]MDU4129558.1 hypothetical protein [Pantoea sp.]